MTRFDNKYFLISILNLGLQIFLLVTLLAVTYTLYSIISYPISSWWAIWLSGNALASIKVVALRQTRLVPGWVTVCERVNHLGV